MSFLPEDDQEFLELKGLRHDLKTEKLPDGKERYGIIFPAFAFEGNLRTLGGGNSTPCGSCDLLILIPTGYATTKLDSFYTRPVLKRPDGSSPACATGLATLFAQEWQFWSRHLADAEWRAGIDGLDTFLQYVRVELRMA